MWSRLFSFFQLYVLISKFYFSLFFPLFFLHEEKLRERKIMGISVSLANSPPHTTPTVSVRIYTWVSRLGCDSIHHHFSDPFSQMFSQRLVIYYDQCRVELSTIFFYPQYNRIVALSPISSISLTFCYHEARV